MGRNDIPGRTGERLRRCFGNIFLLLISGEIPKSGKSKNYALQIGEEVELPKGDFTSTKGRVSGLGCPFSRKLKRGEIKKKRANNKRILRGEKFAKGKWHSWGKKKGEESRRLLGKIHLIVFSKRATKGSEKN